MNTKAETLGERQDAPAGQADPSVPHKGSLRAHLLKGAAGSFVLQVGFAGLSFLNAVILARVLGAEGYGAFTNAMAWVSLLTIPATFGFGILLVRDVAIYRARGQWGLLKGLLRFADRWVLVSSIFLALLAALLAAFLFQSNDQAILRHTLWVALFLLPLFALYNLREATLRGLEHVILARVPGMLFRPGILLAGVTVLYLVWPLYVGPRMAMWINVGAGIAALTASHIFMARAFPHEFKNVIPRYNSPNWLKAASPMLIYSGAQIILGQTDIVMLGAMRTASEVGLYAIANRLAFLIIYIMMTSNMIVMPVLSRLYAINDTNKIQRLISLSVSLSFILTLPCGIILLKYSDNILYVFGAGFSAAEPVLVLLVFARIIDVFLGVGTGVILLTVAGEEMLVAKTFVLASMGNVILNILLIPDYGMLGAAAASMLALLSAKLFLAIQSYKILGVRVPAFLGLFPRRAL